MREEKKLRFLCLFCHSVSISLCLSFQQSLEMEEVEANSNNFHLEWNSFEDNMMQVWLKAQSNNVAFISFLANLIRENDGSQFFLNCDRPSPNCWRARASWT